MYKTNTTLLDWVMILTKVSYTMVAFVVIKIFVMLRAMSSNNQKLVSAKNTDFDKTPKQTEYHRKKTALEQHFLQELYLTKSVANPPKKDR